MNKEIKDKFVSLAQCDMSATATHRLVELLFMVEDMTPEQSEMVTIHIRTDKTIEIPRTLYQEIQSLLDDEKKIPAIKLLRRFFTPDNAVNGQSSLGLKEAKDAVEDKFHHNWNLPKITYRDSPPIHTYGPPPLGCTYCGGYVNHPSYVDQMKAADDAAEVFALDDTGSVEDCQPEDLDPHTLLVYDPLKVGDEADPQDTVNFGPDAIPSWKQDDNDAEEEPSDVGTEKDEEGPIKRCCDCDAVLIFDEQIRCNPCRGL